LSEAARDARPSTDRRPGAQALGRPAEIASSIATALGQTYGVVHRDMEAQLASGEGPGMTSYACVLKANTYRRTFRDELRQPVLDCLEAAVAREPDHAELWALLGWLHLDAARYGFVPATEAPAEMGAALGFASRAVAIDPENVVALRALSAVQYHLGNFDESERIQRQALALNPEDPDTLAQLAWRLCIRGRWEEGLAYSERAIARTIDPPGWYYDPQTIHLYLEGRYRETLASAKHTAAGDSQGIAFLAIAHGALGDRAAAREALAAITEQAPDFARDPATAFRRFLPLESIVEALMDGLRKAGWKEPAGAPTL
jgi:tetratricopeptide (TPR) repeat protein